MPLSPSSYIQRTPRTQVLENVGGHSTPSFPPLVLCGSARLYLMIKSRGEGVSLVERGSGQSLDLASPAAYLPVHTLVLLASHGRMPDRYGAAVAYLRPSPPPHLPVGTPTPPPYPQQSPGPHAQPKPLTLKLLSPAMKGGRVPLCQPHSSHATLTLHAFFFVCFLPTSPS